MKRSHAAAAVVLLLLVAPGLAGCFSGKAATTNMQATMNSGNGVATQLGAIHVENATLVMGPEGSKAATLTMRVVNTGPDADALVYAKINGQPATITGDQVALDPGASVSFGFDSKNWVNAYAFDAAVSTYVPVELGFQKAGVTETPLQILTVPPVGYYEGIAPNPPTAPVAASAAASAAPASAAPASASPSPAAS